MANNVLCTSVHAVHLDDGRVLAPGDIVTGIDTSGEHNLALINDGHLIVLAQSPFASTKSATFNAGVTAGGE